MVQEKLFQIVLEVTETTVTEQVFLNDCCYFYAYSSFTSVHRDNSHSQSLLLIILRLISSISIFVAKLLCHLF